MSEKLTKADAGLVTQLRTMSEEQFYYEPATCHRLVNKAADALEILAEALRPFATYMDNGGDLDNNGLPLPDEQTPGWVYLTMADFRRARAALASTRKEP